MVDEMRYPVVYESKEMSDFRKEHLTAFDQLAKEGISFTQHYASSTACTPSRSTLYTGQYPSLHGVKQTDGVAKGAYDADMFWLDPQGTPTFGHMFKENGYQTYWVGKWHVSAANLNIPGTRNSIPTYDTHGIPNNNINMYQRLDVLQPWGFDHWIGPEPHGPNPLNSGSSAKHSHGRDMFYAEQGIRLLDELSNSEQPWFMTLSFVNPHDITLYAYQNYLAIDGYDFDIIPDSAIPKDPFTKDFKQTLNDKLYTKPAAQKSYQEAYNIAFPSIHDKQAMKKYFRVYYNLQRKVNHEIQKIIDKLDSLPLKDNTIVVLTSDHGDLLGSHGYMQQKWYNMYEESIHIPLYIRWPGHIQPGSTYNHLSSHVDLVPTLLNLVNIHNIENQSWFSQKFYNSRKLVGNDLSQGILNPCSKCMYQPVVFFMTNDNILQGLNEILPTVIQPNSVYAVILMLVYPGYTGKWKYSSYVDVSVRQSEYRYTCIKDGKTKQVDPNYEMYYLQDDPMELHNYIYDIRQGTASTEILCIRDVLHRVLLKQFKKKALHPVIDNDQVLITDL